jgi:hypothetical protein
MCEAKKFLLALFNKTQKLCIFMLHHLADIIIDEFKTKGSLVYGIARIIKKMETEKEFQIYRDWQVDGDRQLGIFQVVPVQNIRAYGGSNLIVQLNINFGSRRR